MVAVAHLPTLGAVLGLIPEVSFIGVVAGLFVALPLSALVVRRTPHKKLGPIGLAYIVVNTIVAAVLAGVLSFTTGTWL